MSRRAWAGLFVLSAMWGAVYPLITVALRELPPAAVVFGRVLLAALILVPFAVHRDALRPLWRRPRMIVETVLVQSTVPLLLLTYGQRHVPAGLAGVLIGAQPLFVALLATRFDPEERPRGWRAVAGLGLGFVGLVVLFGVDVRGGHRVLLGGALVLVAAVCYAAGAIMIHRRHAEAQPLGVATSAMLVTGAVLLVPVVATVPPRMPGADVVGALLILGTACTGATLVLFYTLIARTGPARAALAFYLSPAFAVVFGAVFLGEPVTVTTVAGLVAIVAGAVLVARRAEPAPP